MDDGTTIKYTENIIHNKSGGGGGQKKKKNRQKQQQRRRIGKQNTIIIVLLLTSLWSVSQLMSMMGPSYNAVVVVDETLGNNILTKDKLWKHQQSRNYTMHKKVTIVATDSQPLRSANKNATSATSHKQKKVFRHPNFHFDFPMCLVHIGKTAGSSISCGLGFQYADCEGMPRQELPHTHYFHMKKNNCQPPNKNRNSRNRKGDAVKIPDNEIATFLFTVRNPLTRIQSWFEFEKNIVPTRQNKKIEAQIRRKRGLLFVDCYTTFEAFVNDGLRQRRQPLVDEKSSSSSSSLSSLNLNVQASSSVFDMTCQERAWAAAMGVRDFSYHEYYNYEHYYTSVMQQIQQQGDDEISTQKTSNQSLSSPATKPTTKILVLRTEHLADDWSRLSSEKLFRQVNRRGTRGNVPISSAVGTRYNTTSAEATNNTTSQLATTATIHWNNLCLALCDEIQIYKQILYNAYNLNATQVVASINEVRTICPEETTEVRTCPKSTLPTFPLMKVPRRQYQSESKKRLFEAIN
jgi:hypothetical protein